jgi:hypothetical protein
VKEIDMVAFGAPRIVRFGSDHCKGYTLVQLIQTSNITAHFAEDTNDVYLDVFSEPQGVNRLRNIKYAAYTDAKLLRMDEMARKKDFAG